MAPSRPIAKGVGEDARSDTGGPSPAVRHDILPRPPAQPAAHPIDRRKPAAGLPVPVGPLSTHPQNHHHHQQQQQQQPQQQQHPPQYHQHHQFHQLQHQHHPPFHQQQPHPQTHQHQHPHQLQHQHQHQLQHQHQHQQHLQPQHHHHHHHHQQQQYQSQYQYQHQSQPQHQHQHQHPHQHQQSDGAEGIPWDRMPISLLQQYRSANLLRTASASNQYISAVLSTGIGKKSPSHRHRQSQDALLSAVRRHFNNQAINEQEVIVNFLYTAKNSDKAFRHRFPPTR
ncbi:hypothetical protein TWF696_005223 [Orbilia brochopaga]|uniref:Histone deacetylase complex subunit SAP30 Sin3 binding domain-containing protein n=1 Tax=Orbilia brochopaga TaxID=3140254 RepID=A0AAV9V045_9PEZI